MNIHTYFVMKLKEKTDLKNITQVFLRNLMVFFPLLMD